MKQVDGIGTILPTDYLSQTHSGQLMLGRNLYCDKDCIPDIRSVHRRRHKVCHCVGVFIADGMAAKQAIVLCEQEAVAIAGPSRIFGNIRIQLFFL
jgi:hypothetical protein